MRTPGEGHENGGDGQAQVTMLQVLKWSLDPPGELLVLRF